MGREATHPRSTRILQELGDPDRADEIAEEPLEDYAQRRRIQITNPSKRFDVDTTVLNLVVQLWQQVKRRQNWKRRSPICRTKTRNSKTSLTRSPISLHQKTEGDDDEDADGDDDEDADGDDDEDADGDDYEEDDDQD
jgi:hypothetical protein